MSERDSPLRRMIPARLHEEGECGDTGIEWGFGLAPLKREDGEVWPDYSGYVPTEVPQPSRLARVTEYPRRKLAIALERLADWICRDRDEGW